MFWAILCSLAFWCFLGFIISFLNAPQGRLWLTFLILAAVFAVLGAIFLVAILKKSDED